MQCKVGSFFMVNVPQLQACLGLIKSFLLSRHPIHPIPTVHLPFSPQEHPPSWDQPDVSILLSSLPPHFFLSKATPRTTLAQPMPGSTHLKASSSHLTKDHPTAGSLCPLQALPIPGFAHSRDLGPWTLTRDFKGMKKEQSCRRVYRKAGWGATCVL